MTPGAITSQQIADILRADVPGAEERVPRGTPGANTLSANAFSANSTKAKALLGIRYKSANETFADLGKQLLEIEKGEY